MDKEAQSDFVDALSDRIHHGSDTVLDRIGNGSETASHTVDASDIVGWDGPSDPENPMNWSNLRKWTIVMATTLMTFVVSFASSVWAAVIDETADEFQVSRNVMILGITVYMLGFAVGPCIWGPASELYGRTLPMWVGMVLFLLSQLSLGLAGGIPMVLLARLASGLFGSAPLAIVAGMYVDFLGPLQRGIATAVFSAGVYIGPVLGPVVGNLVTPNFGWRSTVWITMIAGGVFGVLTFLITPETSEAVLLRRKALRLRLETSNWSLHARSEEHPADLHSFMTKYLTKPMRMLVLEPILMIFTAYMSLVYGILYLTLTLYPFAFQQQRGWSSTKASLPFLSLFVGILIGCLVIGLHSYAHCKKTLAKRNVAPEDRLLPVVLGSIALPLGLFMFAWTSDPDITPIPQIISGILIGAGIVLVFMCSLAYIVETYLFDANSALAVNTLFRCTIAACFPVFSLDMFDRLGVEWSGSMLALMCIALVPFPLLMLKYGSRIRSWSRYARSDC